MEGQNGLVGPYCFFFHLVKAMGPFFNLYRSDPFRSVFMDILLCEKKMMQNTIGVPNQASKCLWSCIHAYSKKKCSNCFSRVSDWILIFTGFMLISVDAAGVGNASCEFFFLYWQFWACANCINLANTIFWAGGMRQIRARVTMKGVDGQGQARYFEEYPPSVVLRSAQDRVQLRKYVFLGCHVPQGIYSPT